MHQLVVGVDRRGDRFVVRLSSGQSIVARAVVLATSFRPGTGWAPESLATSGRLVADPWTQEVPEGDLLLVGTGLTMVDVAIAADRAGRKVHTVSRHDLVPEVHRLPTTPMSPPPPGITRTASLERAAVGRRRPHPAHQLSPHLRDDLEPRRPGAGEGHRPHGRLSQASGTGG